MSKPITNHELDALLVEAGYDRAHAAFARQVNTLGRDRLGLDLRYDGASIYWWLRGRNPEPQILLLIAAVLSRRTGRRVQVVDLGFAGPDATLGVAYPRGVAEAVDVATRLWRYTVIRRSLALGMSVTEEASTRAGWSWLFDPDDRTVARAGDGRVTAADVDVLRTIQRQFFDLDRRHGGGYARTFVAEFLHREVAPLLNGSYTDAVGRELFAAAAELTAQLGFMAYDGGAMGLAQRAYVQALRLSKASGDRAFGAHVLANMATQAVFMGRAGEAVQLSSAAIGAARGAAPGVVARIQTAAASARANTGDGTGAYRALADAEAAMGRQPDNGPSWASYFSAAHHAGTAIRCFRDLGQPARALGYADTALAISAGGVRTEALHTALLATVHAEDGDLEQATSLGRTAVSLAERVRSHRVEDRIRTLLNALARHRSDPRADEVILRGEAVLAAGVA
ncbi:hypothetical protein [Catellatospora methionotrophica]|uniref:hypothetical protein n=1 Tax=Catellatospora methionotrophica TaxID=121620 RepID=UPI0034078815